MSPFSSIGSWNKGWILATIFSLMVYDLYWIRGVYGLVYQRLLENLPDITAKYPNFYIDQVAGGFADTLRLVAVILLLTVAYLYWLAILPLNIQNIAERRTPLLLFVGFAIQILVTSPTLSILSVKTWRYKKEERSGLIKWGYIAGVSYIFGIWINNMFRWFSMSGLFGPTDPRTAIDLFAGITIWGFLNSLVTLTASLTFAIVGSYMLIKHTNHKLAMKLLGMAIFLIGLHSALYVAYSWFAPDAWRFVLLTEIWPLPFIGLGSGLIKGKL
jgi:hypothetical protein